MALPLELPERGSPTLGTTVRLGVHHAAHVCRTRGVTGRPSPRGAGRRAGFPAPGSGADGTGRRAPRPTKAPGAGPGYSCRRRRHRPSRWVAAHARARGRRVARATDSGAGAEAGAGVGAEAMGGEAAGAGMTRGGAGEGGGAGSAGADSTPAFGELGDPRLSQGGLPGKGGARPRKESESTPSGAPGSWTDSEAEGSRRGGGRGGGRPGRVVFCTVAKGSAIIRKDMSRLTLQNFLWLLRGKAVGASDTREETDVTVVQGNRRWWPTRQGGCRGGTVGEWVDSSEISGSRGDNTCYWRRV